MLLGTRKPPFCIFDNINNTLTRVRHRRKKGEVNSSENPKDPNIQPKYNTSAWMKGCWYSSGLSHYVKLSCSITVKRFTAASHSCWFQWSLQHPWICSFLLKVWGNFIHADNSRSTPFIPYFHLYPPSWRFYLPWISFLGYFMIIFWWAKITKGKSFTFFRLLRAVVKI